MKVNRNYILNIIEYIFVITTILGYNSVYCVLANTKIIDVLINALWQVSLVILTINSFLFNSHKYKNYPKLFLLCIIFLLFTMVILIIEYVRFHYSIIVAVKILVDPLLLIMCFYNSSNCRFIFKLFLKIMTIIAIISLVCWAFISIKPFNAFNIPVNWSHRVISLPSVFYIQTFTPDTYKFLGLNVMRNTSFYFEAPMYSYMLTAALFIKLFMFSDRGHCFDKQFLVLLLADITTFSTTGIIFSILAALYVLILNSHSLGYLMLFIPVILAGYFIKIVFNSKYQLGYNGFSSYNIRSDDISACIQTWKAHMLFGCGINNSNAIVNYMNPDRLLPGLAPGVTTGLFSILAYGGLLLFIYYAIPHLFVLLSKNMYLIGFSVFNILILISTYAQYSFIYIIILSYLWAMAFKGYKDKSLIMN